MYQSLIKPALGDVKNFILDTLFPVSCLSCGIEGFFICPACKISLKALPNQHCISCHKHSPFGLTHSLCLTPQEADQLISFYDYHDEKIAKIVIAGKYNFVSDVYKIFGSMISEKLTEQYPNLIQTSNLFLCPIPLHASRLRWRGFNQAEILSQTLSENLGIPIQNSLIRKKLTKTQKDLKKEERLKNIDNAFALSKENVKDKSFILVDDVTTTGATLREAVHVLKRNGADKIVCVTIARD